MLVVKTRLAPSAIEGLGVFAAEDIKKGTIVWQFVRGVDLLIDPEELPSLPPAVIELCRRYAYLHTETGEYVLCGDDARFVNHSDDPNLIGIYPPGDNQGFDIAAKDIKAGEELTSDYGTFDAEFRQKLSLPPYGSTNSSKQL
jgi:SET domain-containing protein